MAREAERLLDGTGWLPEPLRITGAEALSSAQEVEAGPLPEFLAEDEKDRPEDEAQRQSVAAE